MHSVHKYRDEINVVYVYQINEGLESEVCKFSALMVFYLVFDFDGNIFQFFAFE